MNQPFWRSLQMRWISLKLRSKDKTTKSTNLSMMATTESKKIIWALNAHIRYRRSYNTPGLADKLNNCDAYCKCKCEDFINNLICIHNPYDRKGKRSIQISLYMIVTKKNVNMSEYFACIYYVFILYVYRHIKKIHLNKNALRFNYLSAQTVC